MTCIQAPAPSSASAGSRKDMKDLKPGELQAGTEQGGDPNRSDKPRPDSTRRTGTEGERLRCPMRLEDVY